MKKIFRTFSVCSFGIGLCIGIVGTALSASRAGSSVFPDVPFGSYYDTAIGEMYGLGIITGFNDGTFRPDEGLTRGQAAVLMQRLRNEVLGIETSSSSSSSSRSSSSRTRSSSSTSSSSSSSVPSTATNVHGKFRFTTNAYRLEEDDGSVNVSVVRTAGKDGMVSVEYILVDATAVGDEDYEKQSGTLVFQDGETSKTFSVRLLDDSENEGDETFTIELSNPTGGAEIIDPAESTFTILDDESASSSSVAGAIDGPEEGTFQYSAIMYTANESQGDITIYVERVGGSEGSASVSYSMSDGTARSGVNYTKTSGTLTFSNGETEKSFTVSVEDDDDIEGNKTVNLSLTSPTNGAAVDEKYRTALLTIYDDEVGSFGSGSFRFTENEYDVLESEGFVDIAITRQGGSFSTATVQYKTSDGSAKKNSDYMEAEGVMTFHAGETTKKFRVEVIEDSLSDGGETVNMNISNPSNAGLTSPSYSTLMIY